MSLKFILLVYFTSLNAAMRTFKITHVVPIIFHWLARV